MRIIAGSLGGRHFSAPSGQRTHPMSDKIRGALFNTLGDISGLSVLDAFAGSGAVSFESVSRGARASLAIENDALAQNTIARNITSLSLEASVKLAKASVSAWLKTTSSPTEPYGEDVPANNEFDVIICDPPYDAAPGKVLASLAERARPGGIVVLSLPPASAFQLPAARYQLLAKKTYGDAALLFFRCLPAGSRAIST